MMTERILIVDDEETLCEVLKLNLENEGYDVDIAFSAEEALGYNLKEYSLILLDIMMGEISGIKMAIGVIMGANIGTTVTAWMVSWLGFKADISVLAVPLMLFGFLYSNSKKDKRKNIGELIVGFSLLFLGLSFMKDSVPDLRETPEVLEFVTTWSSYGFGSVLLFLTFGTILTLVLQSSSATMAITLIMLSMGWIPFDMACAMVLGENIGTTITANIAASVGNTPAKRAAMSHTIFNVFGVIWALILFKPFLQLVGVITENLFGLPNPAADGFVVTDPASATGTAALYGLSMLHTLFNLTNTLLLIWFTKWIARAVSWIIPVPKNQDKEVYRLQYISAVLLQLQNCQSSRHSTKLSSLRESPRRVLIMHRAQSRRPIPMNSRSLERNS